MYNTTGNYEKIQILGYYFKNQVSCWVCVWYIGISRSHSLRAGRNTPRNINIPAGYILLFRTGVYSSPSESCAALQAARPTENRTGMRKWRRAFEMKIVVISRVDFRKKEHEVSWKIRGGKEGAVVGCLRFNEVEGMVFYPLGVTPTRILWSVLNKIRAQNKKRRVVLGERIFSLKDSFVMENGDEVGVVSKIEKGLFSGQTGVWSSGFDQKLLEYILGRMDKDVENKSSKLSPYQQCDQNMEFEFDGYRYYARYCGNLIGRFWKENGDWVIEMVPGIYSRVVHGAISRKTYLVDKNEIT